MTPEEWDTATFDRLMFAELGWEEPGVARKRRLYLAAVCRRNWSQMPTDEARESVEATEKYVDGLISMDELQAAFQLQLNAHVALSAPGKRVVRSRQFQLSGFAYYASDPAGCRLQAAWNPAASSQCAEILREIFGNPLRPIAFDPRWRTSDVVGLARAIYDDRAFDRMPILGDALMDAGCANEEIIGHCRGDGPHVRGCWVLDLVLRKS